MSIYSPSIIQAVVSGQSYLKDRAALYVPLAVAVLAFAVVILLLPYETVYLRERAYLTYFLVTVVACVAVFALGTVFNALVWMQGKGLKGTPERRLVNLGIRGLKFLFRGRFWKAVSVLLKDALYLSRLKERSTLRWFMHLMILGGFVLMFLLDLVVTFSLDILRYEPMISEGGWAKLWIRDFAFDLTGLMILAGLVIASYRRFVQRPRIVRTEMPDTASILFLLIVVLGGFVLEGMGIAGGIEGHQENVEYSFVGYAFSLVTPESAGNLYDEMWLFHGVVSALFIAYIPFSKLFHMIATPLAIEAEVFFSREVPPP